MKRRLLSMLMALCLMLSLLPVTALASPIEDTSGVTVNSVSDLEEIMNDPETADHNHIWINTENFLWDCGDDKVIIIDYLSNETTDYRDIDLELTGSWIIPEDITVICYENISYPEYPSDVCITIDGNWESKASSYFDARSYLDNKMVINGSLTTSEKSTTSLQGIEVTLNGTVSAQKGGCRLGDLTVNSGATVDIANSSYNYLDSLTLADGVKINANRTITLAGDLTAKGSAVIKSDLWVTSDSTFTGNLDLQGRVRVSASSSTSTGGLTIPAGSDVAIRALDCSGQTVNVAGTLSLVYDMKSTTFDNSTINLTGTMKMIDRISLGKENCGSSITGNGKLELYASYEFGSVTSYPEVFGSECKTDAEVPAPVSKDITIWRNWTDCTHTWGKDVTEEPTCGERGRIFQVCSTCGTEKTSEYLNATGKHQATFTADASHTDRLNAYCSSCERTRSVYIFASDAEFDGKPVENAIIDGEFINPDEITITYNNNDKIGTATASATIGGITISTTFEIVSCVHEAETPATCQTLAVCGKCGESFGELGGHVWSEKITAGETGHYFECTAADCDHVTSEEEFFEFMDPTTLEQWEIIAQQMEMYNVSILDHISENGKTDKASECIICKLYHSFEEEKPAAGGNNILQPGETDRVYGETRYETAFKTADTLKKNMGVEKFDAVVVASGINFADALAGSYLAAVKNAPILITKGNTMDSVKAYIKENLKEGGTVYLLGGTAAVDAAMEKGLDGFVVKRLAGNTRYDTNLAILKEAGVEGKDIIVCTGSNFADSLSAAAVGLPILLVKDGLLPAQKEFLQGTTGKKIIVGGKNAVSETVENQLKNYGAVERLAGDTRYQTSVMVAERFFEKPTVAVLAYAQNFPDGLCGGPLAYSMGAPLILTAGGKEATAKAYTEKLGIETGLILGGSTLISDKVSNSIFNNEEANAPVTYVVNTNTGKFHIPTCSSVGDILDENRVDHKGTREELIELGYDPCGRCHP